MGANGYDFHVAIGTLNVANSAHSSLNSVRRFVAASILIEAHVGIPRESESVWVILFTQTTKIRNRQVTTQESSFFLRIHPAQATLTHSNLSDGVYLEQPQPASGQAFRPLSSPALASRGGRCRGPCRSQSGPTRYRLISLVGVKMVYWRVRTSEDGSSGSCSCLSILVLLSVAH